MNPVTKISGLSKLGIILAAILLAGSIFFPIWKIELFAPQYPEGLVLYINANGLTGNVDIINGLNHYIGMATLHNENFIEFSKACNLFAEQGSFSENDLIKILKNNYSIFNY